MAEGGQDRFRQITALPISTYFSGPKVKWILDNVPAAKKAAVDGNAYFGTVESWLVWWLTGGPDGGNHITDVTNASRTLMMNLETLDWDEEILGIMGIPAFSGLYAPYWRSDARGVVVGLTRFVNKGHLARAVLEANAYQAMDIVEAMNKDSGVALKRLKVDGGMVANELLMQFQADILNVPVIRPKVTETTALGAAYAAGPATRFLVKPGRTSQQLGRR
jgi:glycerol kinase